MADDVIQRAIRFLGSRAVIVGVFAILALYGFEAYARNREHSTPAILGDQSAYLGYARHLYESNYTVTEDRNRMPVYPFLLSLIYRPGMSEDEFAAWLRPHALSQRQLKAAYRKSAKELRSEMKAWDVTANDGLEDEPAF